MAENNEVTALRAQVQRMSALLAGAAVEIAAFEVLLPWALAGVIPASEDVADSISKMPVRGTQKSAVSAAVAQHIDRAQRVKSSKASSPKTSSH